ncbi:unnamed protein product [Linum tenue]|uniref:AMP-activated protein kinase glycogen-binding domain-containing protein n=1 Tax=Linum tenue TaxID=586396 RepID=A0AAV0H2Q8_9ROSI|nr:unnamed protein product [Linum tenue]
MHSAATVKTHLFSPPPSCLLPAPSSRTFPVSVFAVCRSRVPVVVGGGGCGGREQEKTTSNVLSLHRAAQLKEEGPLLGFLDAKKRNVRDSCWEFDDGFVRRCSKDWGSEGDSALEAEILEFMKNSESPELFPSKKQLIDAGRTDLVVLVVRQGGWMASGWDPEDCESESEVVLNWKTDSESRALLSDEKKVESDPELGREASPLRDTSHSTASSTEISLVAAHYVCSFAFRETDNSGVDGILGRLEIQRNANFGFKLPERSKVNRVPSHHPAYDEPSAASKTLLRNGAEKWRIWSEQRAAFSAKDFEACESGAKETTTGEEVDSGLHVPQMDVDGCGDDAKRNKTDPAQEGLEPLSTRLQHMESKLSAILNTLKSEFGDNLFHKASERPSDKHLKHYDAWEFQETYILSQQKKLRSIQAQKAIVEGRMALAILDAQRLVEQKQKKIDDAQKGTQLLRNVYIVWPTEASEVFLAGTFDRWATKRKMERSSTNKFSLYIKLYPGKYEIKFVVDGKWKADPLLPYVQHYGYVNNLLIVD